MEPLPLGAGSESCGTTACRCQTKINWNRHLSRCRVRIVWNELVVTGTVSKQLHPQTGCILERCILKPAASSNAASSNGLHPQTCILKTLHPQTLLPQQPASSNRVASSKLHPRPGCILKQLHPQNCILKRHSEILNYFLEEVVCSLRNSKLLPRGSTTSSNSHSEL